MKVTIERVPDAKKTLTVKDVPAGRLFTRVGPENRMYLCAMGRVGALYFHFEDCAVYSACKYRDYLVGEILPEDAEIEVRFKG